MRMVTRLKTIKSMRLRKAWNLDKLKGSASFSHCLEEQVKDGKGKCVEERWKDFRDTVMKCAEEQIGRKGKSKARKPWITKEMLDKMDERRKWKSVNTEEGQRMYNQINNALRRETDKAKEEWWETECQEIETLDKRGRDDLVYDKVKKLTWGKRASINRNAVKNKDGELTTQAEKVRDIWREYIEELYDKQGKPVTEDLKIGKEDKVLEDEKGPPLLDSEVINAIEELRKGKAAGIDDIPAEFLKNLGEKTKRELIEICKSMYEEGTWPEEFTRTVMVPLPKVGNAVVCGEFRTISLICNASKIMLKVLKKRLETKADEFISKNQFGFRKGCGTRDAIGVMRVLCERTLERQKKDLFICFVDFEKAFDRVNWVKLMEALKNLKVDWKDRRMIGELYMKQSAVVRVAGGESQPSVIGRGVRQGCPLSPILFSIYAEVMMKEAMDGVRDGVIVGGKSVNDVRFADDQGMVSNTERGLQRIMNRLNEAAKKFDMRINVKKTKTMIVSKKENMKVNIMVDGQSVEQVVKFKYLGSMLSDDGKCMTDIKTRIALAKEAFNKRRELLVRRMSKRVKKKIVKCLIWPVVLYGCETWSMGKIEKDKMSAFEMWVWRRMERVSYKDRKTNEQVLIDVGEKRSLLQTVLMRKKNWIGHVMRGDGLMREVMEGRMKGTKASGRPRIGMIDDLKEKSYVNMKRKAQDRELWRSYVPGTCQ
jgi:hypothetical protein